MGTDKSVRCMSQNDKILHYLQEHDSITPREAMLKFGCYRLSARIADLKDRGYQIASTLVCKKDEDGNQMRFAKYTLIKE